MILLSGGDKYYQYSGEVFGDVSAPATIQLILIPNTGLRDSYVEIQPYFGKEVVTGGVNNALGLEIKLDDVTIFNSQARQQQQERETVTNIIKMFIPRQSKLEIISLNTANNNTQTRGVNLIGYYL
tara:strand:+ start:720 stop:1097 length:378 start_codon:yes stop_codon:yes gene_type:complete